MSPHRLSAWRTRASVPTRATLLLGVVGLAGVGVVGGCVSTDPAKDIGRAQELLADRAGLAADWLAPIDAAAARWDGASPLSADDAAAAALARSPALRAKVEEVARSRAELVRSGLLPNPVLSLSLGFPINGAGGPTTIGASLVGNLASILTTGRRKGVATAELEQSVLELADAAISTATQARAMHAHADFADQAAAFAEENAGLVQQSLDITQRRVEAGEASRLDANRVRVLLLQARVEASQFRSQADVARLELLTLMGVPEGAPDFPLAAALSDTAAFDPPDEQTVIALAVTRRLDVAAAMAATDAANQRARVAGASRFDVEAGAVYERDDSERDTLGPSVSIGIPIFDTGQAGIAAARAEARAAAHTAESVRQNAIGQARAAWVRARADASAAGSFAADIVQLADDNLELARRAYDAGEEDLTVLLETQRQRISANLELLKLRERAVRSRIDLARAVGGSLDAPDTLVPPAQ